MPIKKDIDISIGKVGMNKDGHPTSLKKLEYTHAKNSNIVNDNGDNFFIQTEHSNILSTKFKEGFKVIFSTRNDTTGVTYYFLKNVDNGVSEIGYIEDIHHIELEKDTVVDGKAVLSKPLVKQPQTETQEYKTLINDSCNLCLNFSITRPVKYAIIKQEKTGSVMYFTDGKQNPPRYLELDNLEQYKYEGEYPCEDPEPDTCLACEKLEMFKRSKIFNLEPEKIITGGNLKKGTYEFLGASCDINGNETSRYFSLTPPISIFDIDNNIMESSEISDETNYAIKLKVNNLDKRFKYYKIAVIQNTDINNATSYFVEGVHPVSETEIIYTTYRDKKRISIDELIRPSVKVEHWDSMTTSNGFLFGNGVTYEKELNLQPVVNLMGLFLKWQSNIAKEDLYKDGTASAKYRGNYRDESSPFGIRFELDGSYSTIFPFIGRPIEEGEDDVINNKDTQSINKDGNTCVDQEINKRWQVYNTAEELGTCDSGDKVTTNTITEKVQKSFYQQPNQYINIHVSGIQGEMYVSIGQDHYSIFTDFNSTPPIDTNEKVAQSFVTKYKSNIENITGVKELKSFEDNIVLITTESFEGSVDASNVNGDLEGTVSIIKYLESFTEFENKGSFKFSISLDDSDQYLDFPTYVNENKDSICKKYYQGEQGSDLYDLCSFLDDSNYDDTPNVEEKFSCNNSSVVTKRKDLSGIEIVGVIGEEDSKHEVDFPDEYTRLSPPNDCLLYDIDYQSGDPKEDDEFEKLYMIHLTGSGVGSFSSYDKVGVRNYNHSNNETCNIPIDIFKQVTNVSEGYFHNYYGTGLYDFVYVQGNDYHNPSNYPKYAGMKDNMYYPSLPSSSVYDTSYDYQNFGIFGDRLQKGALWFNTSFEGQEKSFILDLTRLKRNTKYKDYKESSFVSSSVFGSYTLNTRVRINIYTSCGQEPFISKIVNSDSGLLFKLDLNDDNSITVSYEEGGSLKTFTSDPTSGKIYVAIDTPITVSTGLLYPDEDSFDKEAYKDNGVYQDPYGNEINNIDYDTIVCRLRTVPLQGCFSLIKRNIVYDRVDVEIEDILIRKKETYEKWCDYNVPLLGDCDSLPWKYGKFAYVESTEEYPDNKELYDSSSLKIKPDDLPNKLHGDSINVKDFFENAYVKKVTGGYYEWKTDVTNKEITNFRCRKIRHFKFPDNKVSPFMLDSATSPFSESLIFPLGVTIDEDVINSFLDIAQNNGLITKEEREKIKGYEIVRGDRRGNESIESKGITFDNRKYQESGKDIYYPSYPFNDLGHDKLFYKNNKTKEFVDHPYGGEKNDLWTFDSPELDYGYINNASLMSVEGFVFGKSRGQFNEVREHPKWVILGDSLRKLATTLATIEVVAEAVIAGAEILGNNWTLIGISSGGNTFRNLAAIGIVEGFQALSASIFKYARYKYQWLQSFKNLGSLNNFAYYYTAEGFYNYFKSHEEEGNKIRSLNVSKYLKSSRYSVIDKIDQRRIEVNNIDREKSLLLSTGEQYTIEYPEEYKNYDNSNVDDYNSSTAIESQSNICKKGLSDVIEKNVASMYVALKNISPSQYGTIGSIRWLNTGYHGDLTKPKDTPFTIFGGDVYITRHTYRRTMPIFLTTEMGQADLQAFDYKAYSNIGTEPRFYCSYDVNSQDITAKRPVPDLISEYNFDCEETKNGYVAGTSKFYLYYNGIPNYLVESTINTNYRYGKKEPWNNFYPNVGDMMEWTQEVVNPIRRGNTFFYNKAYSGQGHQVAALTLPIDYKKEIYDKTTDMPDGTMYSLPDNSENNNIDPWLIYRPLDRFDFKTKYGKLVDLVGIETEQVLGRFENQVVIFNAVDQLTDDGRNPQKAVMGDGGIFARRPRTFSSADIGNMGSQSFQMINNEYGHFIVDPKRGQVFRIDLGGRGAEAISDTSNRQKVNMKQWFKENLPFRILKYFPETDVDNPYNGIGISLGWDSRFKRLFLTKKDYIPVDKENIYYKEGLFYNKETDKQVSLNDTNYFKDVSFTVAYHTGEGRWISFYDFKPNFYVGHQDYFQTGYNNTNTGDTEENGLWSHLLTERSYLTFCGKTFKWEIELPVEADANSKYLGHLSYSVDSRRYKDQYSYFQNNEIGFEEVYIFNEDNISGLLLLDNQKTTRQSVLYPINETNAQRILQVIQDGEFTFNYVYNRAIDNKNGLILLERDINNIDKIINSDAVSFKGKRVLERLRGKYFLINLKSGETQHRKIFKYIKTKSNLYNK